MLDDLKVSQIDRSISENVNSIWLHRSQVVIYKVDRSGRSKYLQVKFKFENKTPDYKLDVNGEINATNSGEMFIRLKVML